jgi:hypothetical protein
VAGKVSYEERSAADDRRTGCQGCCLGLETGMKDLQEKLEYFKSVSTGPRLTRSSENLIKLSLLLRRQSIVKQCFGI